MTQRRSALGHQEPTERSAGLRAMWETDLLERLPDGLVVVDERGRIIYANRQAESLSGYRRRELVGRAVEVLVPSKLRALHKEHRGKYAAHPKPRPMGSADGDFRLRRKDGTEFPVDIALGPVGRPPNRQSAAVIRDARERRKLESDLKHRALHDPLTDLANRALFFDRLKQAMLGYRRDRQPVALVLLDIDRFKVLNDAFGHVMGDAILRQLAARLQAGVRATDTVARIGGDEFAWILPRMAGPAAAVRKVRALLRSLGRTYVIDGNEIRLGVSAGMALFPDDGHDADALMRRADLALYSAKRQGVGLALIGRQVRHAAATVKRAAGRN